ncbi:MAG: hypothetical protein K0Q55_106 [Verrucomicrobia bacterium]|nr:hypothetical protein [Verrucomicrobiota bacterium]
MRMPTLTEGGQGKNFVLEALSPNARSFPRDRPGKTFFPQTGSESEWNAAYYRLEDYFRSLHVFNKVHQSQLILRLLQAAAAKHAVNPDQNPTTLAMEEAHAATDRWFRQVLEYEDQFSRQGRLSLFITDGMERWPTVFLTEEVPPDYQRAMQESRVQSGPDLQVSSMVPRPLDDSPLVEIELPESWTRGFSFFTAFAIAAVLTAVFFFFLS